MSKEQDLLKRKVLGFLPKEIKVVENYRPLWLLNPYLSDAKDSIQEITEKNLIELLTYNKLSFIIYPNGLFNSAYWIRRIEREEKLGRFIRDDELKNFEQFEKDIEKMQNYEKLKQKIKDLAEALETDNLSRLI